MKANLKRERKKERRAGREKGGMVVDQEDALEGMEFTFRVG